MATVPVTLPREVLKWIQGLDLQYSCKNVKRDFSNGYLVAEIFSRYYEKDLSMHSFSYSTSLRNKRDNWEQLVRFFDKHDIPVAGSGARRQSAIDDIMKCQAGAAVLFLNEVYEFFTHRKVQQPPPRPADAGAPAFARPTATQAIRETLRDPGVEAMSDLSAKESKMRDALYQHEVSLAEDKLRDPERYTRRNKVVRGITRTVGREESKSSVEIKQVAVKSVDANVAHLRATKEMQASTARMSATGAGFGAGASASRSVMPDFDAAGLMPAIATMSSCVNSALAGRDSLKALDPSQPVALAFSDLLVSGKGGLEDAHAVDVFREIALMSNAEAISDACLMSPRDFYQVVSVFQPVITALPESSVAFPAVIDAFVSIGKVMMTKDSTTSVRLFRDFALAQLAPLIKSHPTKRHAVLRLMYAFSLSTATGRLQAIRSLQRSLDDLPAFLHCLTVLIFLEDSFDDDLLDLYLYYTLIGMGMSSPPLRAACVAMLSVIAAHNPDVGPGVVDRLVKLRDDSWWEVRAQLIIVSAALLQRMTPVTEADAVKSLVELVVSLMQPSAGPLQLRVAVAYISPLVRTHNALMQPFIAAALALPSAERMKLLDRAAPRDQLPVWGVSGGKYRLPCAAASWPADAVCRALTAHITAASLEHLDVEHYELLLALLRPATGPGIAKTVALSAPGAGEAFKALQNHLFVGLCDVECCSLAIDVLEAFIEAGLGADVVAAPPLEGTLVLLHRLPPGEFEAQCQAMVASFLRAVAARGDAFEAQVKSQLSKFKASYGDALVPSTAALVEELGV